MNFTKQKFLKLEKRVQHKKCATLLRTIYEELLSGKNPPAKTYTIYGELISWMELPDFNSTNLKEIADHYHYHLQKSSISLKEHNLLPQIRKGDHEPKKEFGTICTYLGHLRSANNVGSIIRTIEALRLGPIYFHEKMPFIDNDKVIKTSMGTSNIVPCYQLKDLKELPRPLIAIETGENAENIAHFPFPSVCTLIIGNEEYGISDETLKEVDHIVEIPLFGVKNSINAACALAIAAHEACKN